MRDTGKESPERGPGAQPSGAPGGDAGLGDARHPGPVVRPLKTALILVVSYFVLCVLYIQFSGALAARAARSVSDLQRIESVKGSLFILVTSLGLFALSWALLRHIARQEAALVRQRDALLDSERRAVAGLFASSVAHDINNILTVLRFDLDDLVRGMTLDTVQRELVERLRLGQEDLKVLARRLSLTGKRNLPGAFLRVDLVALAREVVDFAQTHSRVRRGSLSLEGEETLPVDANPTMIRQLLLNLIINAADAAAEGEGRIRVVVRREHGKALLEVHDSGPGIPPDQRELVFDPLYSTKAEGAGLGLLSVKVYAEAHRGAVRITDSPLGGACFVVELTAAEPEPAAVEEQAR